MTRFCLTLMLTICFAASFLLSAGNAVAQSTPRSELDLLTQEDIQQELGLTAAQIQKLEELKKNSNPGQEFMAPYLQRMAATSDEAERGKIRTEMIAAVAEARGAFQVQAVEVLADSQKRNLRRLFIERAGVRAMSDPRVAADLKFTDEQKSKLEELSNQRRDASRQMGFNVPDEEQQKFEEEWTGRFLTVLTDEQKQLWEQAQASSPVAAVAATEGGSAASAGSAMAAAEPGSV
ncbi:MAG: hypothetical protein KDA85_16675, partial [Planctomycetaceae bacterium]|nr:hypothetical protein [Planctomycetaceae bacterium]